MDTANTDPQRSSNMTLVGRALRVFEQAVELDAAQRDAFLVKACAGEPSLREAVDELFVHHQDTAFQTAGLIAATEAHGSLGGRLDGAQLGSYRLLERAGMGGMGVVYRAEQVDPQRIVALKVVRVDVESSELQQRFRREVHLLAQLQHPGIAQVFDSGSFATDWGVVPYFAMEFVDGQAIDDFVRERSLEPRAICALMIQVCEAVQHAHERGVLHRDLKPSNLFVVDHGGGRLQPKVLDFGIARSSSSADGLTAATVTGQLLGTLAYMSPERTEGEANTDHRADVYSLGVVLYELLANRLPFDLTGRSLLEVGYILRHDEPTRLGARNTELRGDLETVVGKALARDLDRRYPSAAALAEDLQRYLDHRPVQARPVTAWYFLRKSIARHRTFYGGLFATLLVLVIGLVTALSLASANQVLAGSERAQRERAVAARDDLRETLYGAEMRLISAAQQDPRGKERTRQLLAHWLPDEVESTPDLRGFEWFVANGLIHSETLVMEATADTYLDWLPEGITYAAPGCWVTVDPVTGERIERPRRKTGTDTLRYTASRDRYAVNVHGGFLVARTADDEVIVEVPRNVATSMRISPDGRFIASASMPLDDGVYKLAIYDVERRRFVRENLPHKLGPRSFEFSHAGELFAEAVTVGRLNIWTLPAFDEPRGIDLPAELPHSMAWSQDDSRLAIGYRFGPIEIYDVASLRLLKRFEGLDGCVTDLRWSRDNTRLLSSCSDSTVRVWDVETGRNRVLGGHHGSARRISWSPDETQVVSVGLDQKLRIFDVENDAVVNYVTASGAPSPWGVAWHEDGERLVVFEYERTLYIDPKTRAIERELPGRFVRFSRSKRYYSAVFGDRFEVRDAATHDVLAHMDGWRNSPAHWHPTQDRLAIAHHADGIWIWSPEAAELELVAKEMRVHLFDWHPDGESLLGAAGSVGCFRFRPTADGWQRKMTLHPGDARLWARSPDAARYAMQYANREFRVFDEATGELQLTLMGAADDGHAIAWNPSGSRIATVGKGGALRIWDAETGLELYVLMFEGETSQLAWHPDGDRLVMTVGGRVVVVDARPGR